jgi:hypothetical protein
MTWTNYLPIFNHYVYSDLNLRPITLDQGHDTSLGPGQQSCEILFKSTKRIRSYDSDGCRTTDGQRHNIIRPVWRWAHKKYMDRWNEFSRGDQSVVHHCIVQVVNGYECC